MEINTVRIIETPEHPALCKDFTSCIYAHLNLSSIAVEAQVSHDATSFNSFP